MSDLPQVAVTASARDPAVLARAQALARRLELEFVPPADTPPVELRFVLVVTPGRVELVDRLIGGRPVYVDFARGPVGLPRQSPISYRQPLATGIGLRRGTSSVVDATAGLGRDAFLLACLGCRVTAIERSPAVFALMHDGLERAVASGLAKLRAVVNRIDLRRGDARDLLKRIPRHEAPDAVYLDPMYVPRGKSALPKKELRVLRALVGDDKDASELFSMARRIARRRVVVKRHPHAPPISPAPDLQFSGKQARYDVYLVHGQ